MEDARPGIVETHDLILPSSRGIDTLASEERVIWSRGTPASSTLRTASSGFNPVTLPERWLRFALKSRTPPF
jgi:hypothetical protein